jgi:hypothetical protein
MGDSASRPERRGYNIGTGMGRPDQDGAFDNEFQLLGAIEERNFPLCMECESIGEFGSCRRQSVCSGAVA